MHAHSVQWEQWRGGGTRTPPPPEPQCHQLERQPEGFPLEGKLSPKVTDEVSPIANMQFFCQKRALQRRFYRVQIQMGPPHPPLTRHLLPVAAAPRFG